jgi:hypothetical protein
MKAFWPPAEAAQVDYEELRAAALEGQLPASVAAARFLRRGLAGLIAWPVSEPAFLARLVPAARPVWSPHTDPRTEALAATYGLLLAAADEDRLESWSEEGVP